MSARHSNPSMVVHGQYCPNLGVHEDKCALKNNVRIRQYCPSFETKCPCPGYIVPITYHCLQFMEYISHMLEPVQISEFGGVRIL